MRTLGEFILAEQSKYPNAKGDLSGVLSSIRLTAKLLHRDINRAGLISNILGKAGSENVQGEEQMKLDVLANETMEAALFTRDDVAGFASEEETEINAFDTERGRNAKYIVLSDPIDGSSNTDVAAPIGTIFSIYHRLTPIGSKVTLEDFLQPGSQQVASGYIVYGSSTMLVLTTGNGVNCFTYEPSLGMFLLSNSEIQYPQDGSIYSVNEGSTLSFPQGIQQYIAYCKETDKATNRPYKSRYIGSLVSDFHRNMIKGGIFLYPQASGYPNGKLRLLYECNPIAFICEQAGGIATDGKNRILDIQPSALHERTPFITGSANMVKKALQYLE